MTAVRSEPAPAKINLDLIVTGKRIDGYHELDSLVVFTAFGDRLEFREADDFSLEIDGPFASATPIENNIILRAAHLFQGAYPQARPLAFKLMKNMPVASGIGGGSSDAAAALRALQQISRLEIDPESLRDLGAKVGADLPVCLYAHPARMRDIGTRLDPVRGLPELPLVLVNSGKGLSTAEVFEHSQFDFERPLRPPLAVGQSITSLAVWLQSSRNDLEEAAFRLAPEIRTVLDSIASQDGVLLSRMSGSGATCFGLFSDHKRADRAATLIRQRHPDWWVAATRTLS